MKNPVLECVCSILILPLCPLLLAIAFIKSTCVFIKGGIKALENDNDTL
jgi:hypothetical protein